MSPRPRVLIVGTGALASYVAGRLAQSRQALVSVAGTWREALDSIAARGVTVEQDGEVWTVPVDTRLLTDTLGPADFVLVLVKSHRTRAVAEAATHARAPEGLVVTLQNGLGNREVLASAAGEGHVGVGVVTAGARLLGPGHVRAVPGPVALGCDAATEEPMARLAALFRGSGLPTETTREIARLVWRKLAVNCAINPLTALLDVTNGALLDRPEARETLERAAREVGDVARAGGIALDADPAALALDVAARTSANRSSMLQDLDRGARTEVEELNGAVVSEGRRLGVPTPVNESLWRAVREREAARRPALRQRAELQ